jgi:UDP-3-O-[3-hydroxymyristoyl] glucosamine N-acyltransferase
MARTADELAKHLGMKLEGDPRAQLSGVASHESATPEDLIYVDSPRFQESAQRSAARCVLAFPEANLRGKTLLRTAKPKLAFAKAAAWLLEPSRIAEGIHPTAIVAPTSRIGTRVSIGPYAVIEDEVEIGAGTEIGAFCFLGRGSVLGDHCRLFPHVTLYPGVRLGRGVILHSGAVLGGDGFGYVYGEGRHWKFPQVGKVEIGNDVEIGSNTTVDRGSLDNTQIAAGVKIDNLVQIAHNVRIGENSVLAGQAGISGSSSLGRDVLCAGQVGVGEHATVEDGAILAARAGVFPGKTVRSGQTVMGYPARPTARFKEQHGWLTRLPQIAERLKKLERAVMDARGGEAKKNG